MDVLSNQVSRDFSPTPFCQRIQPRAAGILSQPSTLAVTSIDRPSRSALLGRWQDTTVPPVLAYGSFAPIISCAYIRCSSPYLICHRHISPLLRHRVLGSRQIRCSLLFISYNLARGICQVAAYIPPVEADSRVTITAIGMFASMCLSSASLCLLGVTQALLSDSSSVTTRLRVLSLPIPYQTTYMSGLSMYTTERFRRRTRPCGLSGPSPSTTLQSSRKWHYRPLRRVRHHLHGEPVVSCRTLDHRPPKAT